MFPLPTGRILLGFSGGPDSVGLAAALAGDEILLAYADHRLRGARASREERRRVSAIARLLGRRLVRTRLSGRDPSEAGARRERYRALTALARRHGCVAIATAHTADDLAETVLFNMLRGTGLRGLGSLRPAVVIDGVLRVRPALDERRADLRAWAGAYEPVQDLTNRSCRASRARLRGLLLPALGRRLGEDPVPVLCALAKEATAMRAVLEKRAAGLAAGSERRRLVAEPEVAFPYLVEAVRRRAGRAGPPLTRNAYRSLRAFLEAGRSGRSLKTPGGETWSLRPGGGLEVS